MKKRPVGRPRTTGTTPLSTFRLSAGTVGELERLAEQLNTNKTVVVTLAIRRLARTELAEQTKRKGKG